MHLKLRRYWPLILTTILTIVGLILFFGESRIIAYTVDPDQQKEDTENSLAGSHIMGSINQPPLYESEIIHSIEIDIPEEDLESMLLTYNETGEKEFFPADIKIDGYEMENVGIRLKGNSSLRSALDPGGNSLLRKAPDPGGDSLFKNAPAPGGNPGNKISDATGNSGNKISDATNKNSTPYLIKLDEYDPGKNYQGYTEIALRNNFKDNSYLHEVLGYELLEKLNVKAPRATFGGVSLNDGNEKLYVLTEHPNKEFLEDRFKTPQTGTLIKAGIGSDLNYLGEDPTLYTELFDLKTNENEDDLNDLIEFTKFIDQSTDEEFIKRLEDFIDVNSLLRYLVFCNATVNMDSFPGNSNNYYLYQNPADSKFTLIPWDLNEIFGEFWHFGETKPVLLDIFFEREDFKKFNKDFAKPNKELKKFPVTKPVESSNILVNRIMEQEEFREKYLEIYKKFIKETFNFAELDKRISEISDMILKENKKRNFLDTDVKTYLKELERNRSFLNERIEFLKKEIYN